eukprot:gene16657-19794_t
MLEKFGSHFFCSIHSISTHPMCIVLSNFTHTEAIHFLFNMIGLWTFGTVAYDHMGTIPFLLLYMGGGLVGTMTSVIQKLITRSFSVPSIGASGCVLAVVAASILFEPNNRVSIIFLPMFSFESQSMLYGLIAFDALGAFVPRIAKFTNFDHSCHLGSLLCGAAIGDSYRYKSKFQHFQGQGTTTMPKVWRYTGEFTNGNFNGQGTLHKIPENGIYKGTFTNGFITQGHLFRDSKTYTISRPRPQE